ncbi:uncharacterized protein LOC117520378 isoform X3 [Thalassophryne amazonica]|uniref:uncharacterized protein LOC117520378 isoform X3 n=1 Tax=Thalassophryne amazonica TaxID=390379 RepID=UPI001470B8CB|nr:uncharacterized protein LOC117520378 isoform X3 [Thalassophryne amazonica]
MMLLFLISVSFFFFLSGLSAFGYQEVCYGNTYKFPLDYVPPLFMGKVFFTSSKSGASKKLVIDKGKAVDPRYKVTSTSVSLPDLTESDDGTFSKSQSSRTIRLKIVDCSEEILKTYGEDLYYDISRQSEFLEFTPTRSLDQPKVLWNQTSTQSRKTDRVWVRFNSWEMIKLSQADNGYYNFRRKDNTLLSRIKLTVREKIENFILMEEDSLTITLPLECTSCTMSYSRRGDTDTLVVMKAGHVVQDGPFKERIWMHGSDQIEIESLKTTDSGQFEVRDQDGNLALLLELNVRSRVEAISPAVYVGIPITILFVLFFCCCCVKKCCCKKGSSKREPAVQTLAVRYQDANQDTGPSHVPPPYSSVYSYPCNTIRTTESASSSTELPVLSPTEIHMSSHPPEVAATGQQHAAPVVPDFGCSSLDSEPKFELKGLHFPLSSEATFCDVYTSDKLNFL